PPPRARRPRRGASSPGSAPSGLRSRSSRLLPIARAALPAQAQEERDAVAAQDSEGDRVGGDHVLPTADDDAGHASPPAAASRSDSPRAGSGGASSSSRRRAASRVRSRTNPIIRKSIAKALIRSGVIIGP